MEHAEDLAVFEWTAVLVDRECQDVPGDRSRTCSCSSSA
jgi:hypothetical protein